MTELSLLGVDTTTGQEKYSQSGDTFLGGAAGASVKPVVVDATTYSHTGDTVETILSSSLISSGTLSATGFIKAYGMFDKTGTAATAPIKFYVNTSNSLSGAIQVAVLTFPATFLYSPITRVYKLKSSLISSYDFAKSSIGSQAGTTSTQSTSGSFDVSVDNYFISTVQLGSASDSVDQIGFYINSWS